MRGAITPLDALGAWTGKAKNTANVQGVKKEIKPMNQSNQGQTGTDQNSLKSSKQRIDNVLEDFLVPRT
jgi:hypothetical protein